MTIILNPFAPACRHLLSKYTISTLLSANIADNHYSYGCILKISQVFTYKISITFLMKPKCRRKGLEPFLLQKYTIC